MERRRSVCCMSCAFDHSGRTSYDFAFSLKAIRVDAPVSRPLAHVLAEVLAGLAGEIEALADSLADSASDEPGVRQELPKLAEFQLDYDRTPFHAIRLVGQSARNVPDIGARRWH